MPLLHAYDDSPCDGRALKVNRPDEANLICEHGKRVIGVGPDVLMIALPVGPIVPIRFNNDLDAANYREQVKHLGTVWIDVGGHEDGGYLAPAHVVD